MHKHRLGRRPIFKKVSTSGYVFLLGGGAISWQSHKQAPVVFSSTKFEYIVVIIVIKESMWLQQLLKDTSFQQGANILYYNNQSCIALAKNPKFHECFKHVFLLPLLA
jgi:hypothetical protein